MMMVKLKYPIMKKNQHTDPLEKINNLALIQAPKKIQEDIKRQRILDIEKESLLIKKFLIKIEILQSKRILVLKRKLFKYEVKIVERAEKNFHQQNSEWEQYLKDTEECDYRLYLLIYENSKRWDLQEEEEDLST